MGKVAEMPGDPQHLRSVSRRALRTRYGRLLSSEWP